MKPRCAMEPTFTKFVIFLICASIGIQAQILNGDFEEWIGGEPLFWHTSNNPESAPGAINVFQTSVAYSGDFAVRGEVITATDINGNSFTLNPFLSTGPITEGFPISYRPEKLGGFYIYKPIGVGGALNIVTYLTRWDFAAGERRIVGSGGVTIFNTAFLDTTYNEFIANISYYLSDIPDTINISVTVFSNDPGTEFYIDNISLTLIEIITPEENSCVVAGEKDTIKWFALSENIKIMYSIDDGNTFTTLENSYPADSGRYIWDVPSDLLSSKAVIRIENPDDNSQFDELPVYIKPWQLTRLDDNDDFELYKPNEDGWNFGNLPNNIWPQTWWQQFNYQTGTDPFTNSTYPQNSPFNSALSSDFPNWELFVDVFSIDNCYIESNQSLKYRSSATSFWGSNSGQWGGSCAGFSTTSLMSFYYKEHLSQYIGTFNDLFMVQIKKDSRYVINYFQTYQKSKEVRNHRLDGFQKSPRNLLSELKDMFQKKNGDARILDFYNNNRSGGHAVVPYKLERINNTPSFNLRVYDSNAPGNLNKIILIDSALNTWTDQTGLNWGTGSNGCFLEREVGDFLNIPSFRNLNNEIITKKTEGNLRLTIFNTPDAEMNITSEKGEQIGYQDSIAFNKMFDAFPIIPLTGSLHPPIGYDLPENNYTIVLNNYSTSSSKVLFDEELTMYDYLRNNVNKIETDIFRYSENGVKIVNPDNQVKNLELKTIILEDSTSEKAFITRNIALSLNDSINIKEKDRSELILNNYGPSKSYELRIIDLSENGQFVFEHSSIQMEQNSGHQIIPDWNDLQNQPVKILIDFGNDGTIDDSIFVKNQSTDIKNEYISGSPVDFNLYRNYPNPFNPATTITFDLPKQELVVLKIYNILGEEVASLVSEVRQAGRYLEVFNASGLPSGVYIYKLTAGEFRSSKKMMFIK